MDKSKLKQKNKKKQSRSRAQPRDPEKIKETKRKAADNKEEARIKKNKKKTEKKSSSLSTAQQFQIIWNTIVLFITSAWETATTTWEMVSAYLNMAQQLGATIVELIGEGNSIVRDHNKQVIGRSINYILMIPCYIMAGISGIFIYRMKAPDTNSRIMSVDNSWYRYLLHKGQYLYLILMSPLSYIIKWLQTTDKGAFTEGSFNLAGQLSKLPHVASFYIPMLMMIALFPSFSPSLFSIIATAGYILFQVCKKIYEAVTMSSIDDLMKNVKSDIKTDTSFKDIGNINPTQFENTSQEELLSTAVQGGIPGMPVNPFALYPIRLVYLVIYSLYQIIVGLVSVIPAAFLGNIYVWIITLFSVFLNDSTISEVLKELYKDTESYPNTFQTKKWLIRALTDYAPMITALFCTGIGVVNLSYIQKDPALVMITGGTMTLIGIMIGLMGNTLLESYK